MNVSKLLVTLILLVVVLAIGSFWMLSTSGSSAPSARALRPGAEPAAALPAPELSAPPDRSGPGAGDSEAAPGGQRELARAGRELEVHVAWPEGAPEDPELTVLAVPGDLLAEHTPDALLEGLRTGEVSEFDVVRAPVRAGRALLQLPDALSDARILIDGRFLFLDPPLVAADALELRATPRLGACITLRLVFPERAEPEGDLDLTGANMGRRRSGWDKRTRVVQAGAELEFRALDTRLLWTLQPGLRRLHAFTELGIELEPGRVHSMEIRFTEGAAVAGLVVDEDGQPRADVEVRTVGGTMGMFGDRARQTTSDANGEFELLGLGPGDVAIEAVENGWVTAPSGTLEVADGERRDDVRLVMGRGLAIAGRIVLPDGSPAVDAEVTVRRIAASGGWGGGSSRRLIPGGEGVSDATGSFRVTGLSESDHLVGATLELGDGPANASWRASEDPVAAGRTDVLITLERPLAFTGRVLDDRGEAVTEFQLRARDTSAVWPTTGTSFRDDQGAFEFALVGPGEWEITASADGHVDSPPATVTLPGHAGELELRLERQASVAGQVVDSIGAPIAQATVRAAASADSTNPWAATRGPSTETDAEGRFELAELAPGVTSLSASAEQWADSLPLGLELAPGEAREDAHLTLRVGGRIEGSIVTPEGDPQVGSRIAWGANAMGFGSRGDTRSDSSGRFVFEHVTPGEWAVSSAPSIAEIGEATRGRRDQSAFMDIMGEMLTKTVSVVDGEVVEVFLGGEPKRPVRVFGFVSRAGEPVADAQVFATSEESAIFEGMKATQTDTDGSFELIVDRPGSYLLNANPAGSGIEVLIDVPRADELRVDLAIPLGRIEGLVREPNASPAAGVTLSLQRQDGLGRTRWFGSQTRTTDDGRYAFEDIEAGLYTVRANVGGRGSSSGADWGTTVHADIEVAVDQATTGIDFLLVTSGSVTGLVRGPDGTPVAGVALFFRDEGGRLVSTISGTSTDAIGRFKKTGLAPGAYSVSARGDTLAAGEAATVSVRSGETAELELEVELGTVLVVTLKDPDGLPRRARIEVIDASGHEVGRLLTQDALRASFNQGSSTREQRVGPLPTGRYTVRATALDGRMDEKRVTLRGRQTEKLVFLKLEEE